MELTTPRLNGLKSEGKQPHVVIVGGGFGGLRAAQALKSARVDVTLIDRRMFELALRSELWHAVEHICFLATALLFWWPVIQPWPSRARWPRWTMIPYLLLADLQNTALSAFLIFCDRVVYPTYATAPRIFGMSVLEDQAAAGAIMWVPGSFAFLIPLAFISIRLMSPSRGAVGPSAPSSSSQRSLETFAEPEMPTGRQLSKGSRTVGTFAASRFRDDRASRCILAISCQ
jgi:Cytochrome c oxidase caa3 assembly factor (Caa3_CtaG)/Pyridine nucleotide-disulphide oxidoreductase